MPTPLDDLSDAIFRDAGLRAELSDREMLRGDTATRRINTMILDAIQQTGANDDGLLTPREMRRLSEVIQADGDAFIRLITQHGYDNAAGDSGFHILRGNGGTSVFQGRNFVDAVADVIYHFGYRIRDRDGQYVNEDGNANGSYVQGAGWLNFFLNGENVIYGSSGNNELGSGAYSANFAKARNETFMAGDGRDKIWADVGNDKVMAGNGNDISGGGRGNDLMFGEAGQDTLYGDVGRDRMYGGSGDDTLGGGQGNDRLYGGADNDLIYGEDGYDKIDGGDGRDDLSGQDGNDRVSGGAGADKLSGGEGADRLIGGAGTDKIYLWETNAAADTLVFSLGDGGNSHDTADLVEGFDRGRDKINLSAFDGITFRGTDFVGNGKASARFSDGFLLIDADGDRKTDMFIEFRYVDKLGGGDFVFD